MWLPLLLWPFSLVHAQLSLPKPPYLPPDSTFGTHPSSGYPNPQWSTLLGNLLYFYDAQRSGVLPETNRVSWRNSSATKDGEDVALDLSGGYYDAGDYIKATFPLSFTLTSVCWGATDFGKGYDLTNQTAYLDDMLRWGLDWMMKAHPSSSTLYVLVGDTDTDNAYWGGDLGIPAPRLSHQINDTNPGTDAAAGAAATFAACSSLYAGRGWTGPYPGPASLHNTTYSEQLLKHAQDLYTFALNATGGMSLYQKSVPAVKDAYASSDYTDELAMAALFLSWAQNDTSLYQEASNYYTKLAGQDSVFNWDSKSPGLPVLFAQIAQTSSGSFGNLSFWQSEAEKYFDRIVDQTGRGHLTPGGLLFYDGDSNDASLNPALNAAMLLTRYAQMASTSEKKQKYLDFARSQVDYALGKNPMNVPYVVGSNPNSPSNPHSALASGGSDITHIDTSPEQEAYLLYGAVIGGPDLHDQFYDIRSDWPETEVALDYNAPMLTLVAMRAVLNDFDPYFTALGAGAYSKVRPIGRPCDAAIRDGCHHPLSKGARIAMGVTLSVTGVFVLGLLGYYFHILRTHKSV